MICSETVVVNRNNREGEYSLLRCRRWSCDHCRPINRWEVIKAACRGEPNMFITLTCNPARYRTADEAAADMRRGFVALRKAICRHLGIKRWPMIAVYERTKVGWPHLHVLCRSRFISQRWLADTWNRITGAIIVDVRRIQDGGRAARYVSKYIGKDPEAFRHCKRWWRTHDYELHPAEDRVKIRYGNRIEFSDVPFEEIRSNLIQWGYDLLEDRPGYVRFKVPDT